VRGYLELLTDSPNVDHIKKPIDNMLSQTKRMQSTIDDLLYLAKLDNETSSLGYHNQKEELSVSAIVQPIMESAEILAERNNQKIHTDIDDTLPITGIKSEKENNHAIFSVTDTGIGIAPNHLDRLTERFYRVDQGRSRDKGGTGLGLSIVQHVLDKHDAKLRVQSNLGSGSSFECIFLLTE